MTEQPVPTLRYFDARGRAQFIRYYLHAREIAFTDERVPLDEGFATWRGLQPDRARSGPFQRLPVMHWGDRLIGETIVIANFLHKANGDSDRLSPEQNLRHEMLISSLSNDVMIPVGTLLWADLQFPGVDIAAMTRRTLERLSAYLKALEQSLDEWSWPDTSATRPVLLADCLLWEELDVLQHVFGERAGIDSLPLLAAHHRATPGRAAFEKGFADAPCQITAHPTEAAAVATIRAALG